MTAPPASPEQRFDARWLTEVLALAALYFATAWLGLWFAMPGGQVTPVWPPSGVAIAAMLFYGRRVLPGIWLGSFAVNLWSFLHSTTHAPLAVSLVAAACIGVGGATAAWLGANLFRRYAGPEGPLESVRNVCAFMGLGGVAGCVVSATNGVVCLALGGFARWADVGEIWMTWWLGDTAGVLVVAPLLLAWLTKPALRRSVRGWETAVCFALLLAATFSVFIAGTTAPFSGKPFTFVLIPFLVWPALRLGQRGAVTAAALVALVSVWGTIHGSGPFALHSRNESLLALELFLSIASLASLCIAALSSEQHRAESDRRRVLDELESRVAERTTALDQANAALRASEQRLRTIIETEPECVKVISPEGRLLEMNAAGLAMLDASSLGELSARSLLDFVAPEYRRMFRALHQRVMAGESDSLEFETIGLKGTRRGLETHAVPLRDAAGRITALLGVTRDITEHKRAEAKLKIERQFSDTVIDGLPGVFYIVDPLRRLRRWNKNFETVSGYTADELGRMDAVQLFSPTELPRVEESFRRVLETGSASVEVEIQPRGGPPVPYFFTGLRVLLGETPCMAGVGIDVSERRQSAALFDGQKEVLELIAKGVPLAESLTALLRVIESQSGEMLCSILLLDDDGVHVRHGAAPSLPEAFNRAIDGQPIGPCAGSCGTAAFRHEPVIVEDIGTDPLWADYRATALTHGLRACWSAPIFDAQKKVLGTFAIYYREPGRPTPRHERLIEIATQTAAIAIVREHSLAALRESEERYRKIFDEGPLGLAMGSMSDGRLIRVNRTACEMLGYSEDELKRLTFGDVTHPEHRAADGEAVRLLREGKISNDYTEKRYVKKNGEVIWGARALTKILNADGKTFSALAMIKDVTERKHAEAALRDLTWRLLRAEDDERRRIAKELHDSTAQDLVAVMMNLGMLRDAIPSLDSEPARILEDSVALVENCASDIRTLSYVLHPPRLDEMGLPGGLTEYAAGLAKRADIRIRVEAAPDFGRLPEELELALFRVAQESLGNVLRHSESDAATIRLARKDASVVLEIQDHGRGMPPDAAEQTGARGVGIVGMRERLQHLGGLLEIETGDGGTMIRAILPLNGETQ